MSALTVRAGSSFRDLGGVSVSLETYYQHPKFNSWSMDYDISILHFASALSFSTSVGSVPLPAPNQAFTADTQAIVTGWGGTSEGAYYLPWLLRGAKIPLVSREDCKAVYRGYKITDRMICAGFLEGGKDFCQVRSIVFSIII